MMDFEYIKTLATRVASLSATVYAAEKLSIFDKFSSPTDTAITRSAKTAVLLGIGSYLGDMIDEKVFNQPPQSLLHEVKNLGVAYVSNLVVLYAMDMLKVDEKLINSSMSDEKQAMILGFIFAVTEEISKRYVSNFVGKYISY